MLCRGFPAPGACLLAEWGGGARIWCVSTLALICPFHVTPHSPDGWIEEDSSNRIPPSVME